MGYTTDFSGAFNVTPPMKPQILNFLNKLCQTRRMGRVQEDNFGVQGEFFVDENVDNEPKVLDVNRPPTTQPGLWCQWDAIDENTIEWDGGEKFYNYTEWLVYIIEKVLKPNGYKVNGEVTWSGEETEDVGKIIVENNVVSTIGAFSSEVIIHKAGENVRTDVTFKVKEEKVDISNVNFVETEDNLLEHAIINQLESDFESQDFDAMSEMINILIKVETSRNVLIEYLGDTCKENWLERRTKLRY